MGSEKQVHSTKRDDYCTPLEIIQRTEQIAPIIFDPCASWNHDLHFATGNACICKTCQASRAPNNKCDGLLFVWHWHGGLVFVNPPYGGRKRIIDAWIEKIAVEASRGCEIVLLAPASTGSQWFARIWNTAQAACFVKGRQTFRDPRTGGPVLSKKGKPQTATFWSFLGYWGPREHAFFDAFESLGELANLNAYDDGSIGMTAHSGTGDMVDGRIVN
jgi:hypothetical protein